MGMAKKSHIIVIVFFGCILASAILSTSAAAECTKPGYPEKWCINGENGAGGLKGNPEVIEAFSMEAPVVGLKFECTGLTTNEFKTAFPNVGSAQSITFSKCVNKPGARCELTVKEFTTATSIKLEGAFALEGSSEDRADLLPSGEFGKAWVFIPTSCYSEKESIAGIAKFSLPNGQEELKKQVFSFNTGANEMSFAGWELKIKGKAYFESLVVGALAWSFR
jgi:hypothetical protein